MEDFSKLTVVLLKERLKAAGLATSGRKADLVERLVSNPEISHCLLDSTFIFQTWDDGIVCACHACMP